MNNNSWRDLSPSLVQVLCSLGCRCVWWTLPIRTVPAVISLAILSWSECKLTKQHFWQLCRWRITCYPGENAALSYWYLYQPGWVTVLVSRGLKALGLDVLNITPKLGILYSNAPSTDLNKRITIFCTFSENDFFLNFPIHPWKRLWKTGRWAYWWLQVGSLLTSSCLHFWNQPQKDQCFVMALKCVW